MSLCNRFGVRTAIAAAVFGYLGLGPALAQPPGRGRNDPDMRADMEVFHFLLDHRADIKRTIKNLPNGVETITESSKADVTTKIQQHVAAMHQRIKQGKGIHLRDPLFAEIFRHHDKIKMTIEKSKDGVKVTETSDDANVARLIQAHAQVVSKFIENGHAEMRKNHALPTAKEDPPKKP